MLDEETKVLCDTYRTCLDKMIELLEKDTTKNVFNSDDDCKYLLSKIQWLRNWFIEYKDIWYLYAEVNDLYGFINGYSMACKKFEDSDECKILMDHIDYVYYKLGTLLFED